MDGFGGTPISGNPHFFLGLGAVQFATPRSAHRAPKAASVFSFAPRTTPRRASFNPLKSRPTDGTPNGWFTAENPILDDDDLEAPHGLRNLHNYSTMIGSLSTYSKSRFALVY